MTFDPYCKLYIQTATDRSEIIAECGRLLNGSIRGRTVENSLLYLQIQDNDSFDEKRFRDEKRFVFSRYSAETEGISPDIDQDSFINSVCDLVTGLRGLGMLVSASCEFEEIISQRTGWNWSESSRDHPQAEVG